MISTGRRDRPLYVIFAPDIICSSLALNVLKIVHLYSNLLPRHFMWTSGYDKVEFVEPTEDEAEVVIGVLDGFVIIYR